MCQHRGCRPDDHTFKTTVTQRVPGWLSVVLKDSFQIEGGPKGLGSTLWSFALSRQQPYRTVVLPLGGGAYDLGVNPSTSLPPLSNYLMLPPLANVGTTPQCARTSLSYIIQYKVDSDGGNNGEGSGPVVRIAPKGAPRASLKGQVPGAATPTY